MHRICNKLPTLMQLFGRSFPPFLQKIIFAEEVFHKAREKRFLGDILLVCKSFSTA